MNEKVYFLVTRSSRDESFIFLASVLDLLIILLVQNVPFFCCLYVLMRMMNEGATKRSAFPGSHK